MSKISKQQAKEKVTALKLKVKQNKKNIISEGK